ncbi:MAG: hypothetical protein KatS3mg051_2205 [Anaerolineae bacterium]|nr:MAG: hypothetical protein KatS3mg051_2205 [Anaerolineae bacterium]
MASCRSHKGGGDEMTPIIIGWIATAVLIWATLAGSAAVERYIHRRELEREAEREGRAPGRGGPAHHRRRGGAMSRRRYRQSDRRRAHTLSTGSGCPTGTVAGGDRYVPESTVYYWVSQEGVVRSHAVRRSGSGRGGCASAPMDGGPPPPPGGPTPTRRSPRRLGPMSPGTTAAPVRQAGLSGCSSAPHTLRTDEME